MFGLDDLVDAAWDGAQTGLSTVSGGLSDVAQGREMFQGYSDLGNRFTGSDVLDNMGGGPGARASAQATREGLAQQLAAMQQMYGQGRQDIFNTYGNAMPGISNAYNTGMGAASNAYHAGVGGAGNAYNAGMGSSGRAYADAMRAFAPFQQRGIGYLDSYAAMAQGLNQDQLRRDYGEAAKGLDARLASMGMSRSSFGGSQHAGLGANYAAQMQQQRLNAMQPLLGVGMGAAQGMSNAANQYGNNAAGLASSYGNNLAGLANSYGNNMSGLAGQWGNTLGSMASNQANSLASMNGQFGMGMSNAMGAANQTLAQNAAQQAGARTQGFIDLFNLGASGARAVQGK